MTSHCEDDDDSNMVSSSGSSPALVTDPDPDPEILEVLASNTSPPTILQKSKKSSSLR